MYHTTPAPIEQASLFTVQESRLDQAVTAAFGQELVKNGYFIVGSSLPSFRQTQAPSTATVTMDFGTRSKSRTTEKNITTITGENASFDPGKDYRCPHCHAVLHGNGSTTCTLSHVPVGGAYTKLVITSHRLRCPRPSCQYTYTFPVDCKADGHRITQAQETYIRELLSLGFTLKEVSQVTGSNENIVKDIDKKRLAEKYTVDGEGKELLKPDRQSRLLGIDEFKLHDGRKYATVIIDLETGHVLYLAHTKKKQVVYDFMDFVGEEWMSKVEAVASDMNADYGSAFQERYPHIRIVYDHFHIVRNFNDRVINAVKKDEVKRLLEEGDEEGAQALKGSKYILMSSRDTLLQKDRDARRKKVLSEASILFKKPEVVQKGGNRKRYKEILAQNELLFTADLVKEKLRYAYEADTELKMKRRINSIISICEETGNKHFLWFANLLRSHYDGIIAHATYHISTGRVEGTNQMIKTLRRQSYGFHDDEYFFLKIMDASGR